MYLLDIIIAIGVPVAAYLAMSILFTPRRTRPAPAPCQHPRVQYLCIVNPHDGSAQHFEACESCHLLADIPEPPHWNRDIVHIVDHDAKTPDRTLNA